MTSTRPLAPTVTPAFGEEFAEAIDRAFTRFCAALSLAAQGLAHFAAAICFSK